MLSLSFLTIVSLPLSTCTYAGTGERGLEGDLLLSFSFSHFLSFLLSFLIVSLSHFLQLLVSLSPCFIFSFSADQARRYDMTLVPAPHNVPHCTAPRPELQARAHTHRAHCTHTMARMRRSAGVGPSGLLVSHARSARERQGQTHTQSLSASLSLLSAHTHARTRTYSHRHTGIPARRHAHP